MPPLPTLSIPALVRLEQQLRFAPKETLLRDIVRAEGLARELADDQPYPEDWIAFRITGHRPDLAAPELVQGELLKSELSSLVERLCDAGKVTVDDFRGDSMVEADDLCTRWNMSRRTLVRMRKRGLVGRRLLAQDGKPRVMFGAAAVEHFERDHAGRIARAADYSRISPGDEARIIKRARRYKRWLGWSLNMAAERIAERLGRSHEAIRQVLKRHETRAKEANERSRAGLIVTTQAVPAMIFDEAEPLTNRRREAVYRAWRLGIDPALVSEKFRRSRPALRRAVAVARAQRLLEWSEEGLLGDEPDRSDPAAAATAARRDQGMTQAAAALAGAIAPSQGTKRRGTNPLDAAPVVTGLAAPVPRTIDGFIAAARGAGPVVAIEEKARLGAYHLLRRRCLDEIAALHRLFPRTICLDRIETMMRWASRLKLELIRSQLRLMIDTVEGRLERRMEDLPRASMPRMLIEGIERIGDAIDGFDPTRGGRLAGAVSLAMDRHAVRWLRDVKPIGGTGRLRASPLLPTMVDLPDWSLMVNDWQRWLEPHPAVRRAADAGLPDPAAADFLARRFGWHGGPPATLASLAEHFDFTLVRAAVYEQRSLHRALHPERPTPVTAG